MARSAAPAALSDLAGAILDPVLRKRSGMSLALLQSWEEVVGPRLAGSTRPERLVWPRRMHEDDPFEPAALVIACEGAAALHVQHETGEIVARINAFMGFAAVGRIRIVQKPVARPPEPVRPRLRTLDRAEKDAVAAGVRGVEDEALRLSLQRLGESVRAARHAKPR
jgi:hypothetical protein